MSPVEDLLFAHLRDVRAKIEAATASADALEQQIERLGERAANAPIAEPTTRARLDGWSEEEDRVLRENYATIGAVGCAKLLPHRSNLAIRVRASRKLGLVCLPAAKRVWCSQCDANVTMAQVAVCGSPFCKAKDRAA